MTSDCVGGVWTYTVDLVRELTRRGHDVVVAVMGGVPTAAQERELVRSGAIAHEVRPYRLEWMAQPDNDLRGASAWLLHLATEHRPDVAHLNQFSFAALQWPCPTVVVAHSDVVTWWRAVHGCDPPAEWADYRARVSDGLRAADRVVAPTAAMLRDLRAAYDFSTPAQVVHNGAALSTDSPNAEKDPQIAAAGRVWDEAKNIATVARAAAGLPWPLLVAGEGSDRLDEAQGLGRLDRAAVADLLARSAIFVAPARYEPFGLAALEAGLRGCALVLGDIPTLREVWGDAALFVAPDDATMLRSVLRDLIDDPDLRRERQAAAAARAATFDAADMAAAYVACYRTLMSAPVVNGVAP